jgi:hypothetical protein
MQRSNPIREKVSVEQADEHEAVEEPELRATVELRTQAKIDSDVRDRVAAVDDLGRPYGMTLEAQEKWEAREAEKRRTRERADRRQDSRREELCRELTQAKHGGMIPPEADHLAELDRETRSEVLKQARRLEGKCRGGLGLAAIERELAMRVARGRSMQDAVLDLVEDVQAAPGSIVALGKLDTVSRQWVDVEGTVATLWESSSPAIQDVGLLEDETGKTKLTVWKASSKPPLKEGQRVRIRDAAVSWYQGRPSIALTGRSTVVFPDRDPWW